MGNHRADHRGPRRRSQSTPQRAELSVTSTASSTVAAAGRRRAAKPSSRTTAPSRSGHTGTRGPLFRGLPSIPVLLGVAALSVSAGGAVTMSDTDLAPSSTSRLVAANALGGLSGQSSSNALEGRSTLSRDSRRDALADAADEDLVAEAEAMTKQRNAALVRLAQLTEEQSQKLESNQWVLPLSPSVTTAEFGDYGLWASYHTGLDFNGVDGQPIVAVAGGTVTSVGYDGSYGNKTVITLEDGTEIWYCHQSAYDVSPGDTVAAGDTIGSVGSTGNVTGSHLHLEVRPGGGDPVDPYAAFVVHGITP